MDRVTDFSLEEMRNSSFVRPLRLRFKQNGRPRVWDLIKVHASVYVIIFNKDTKKLLLVKQFRPTVYFTSLKRAQPDVNAEPGAKFDTEKLPPGEDGITLELCAGIVDKDKSLAEIAQDEIREEVGYEVPLANIKHVQTAPSSVGTGGERMTMFYAEIDDSMKIPGGGGGNVDEGELIDVVELTVDRAKELISRPETNMTPPTTFGIMWFLTKIL